MLSGQTLAHPARAKVRTQSFKGVLSKGVSSKGVGANRQQVFDAPPAFVRLMHAANGLSCRKLLPLQKL